MRSISDASLPALGIPSAGDAGSVHAQSRMPIMPMAPPLRERIAACTRCADRLPLAPKPILQWHPDARVLIAGQAPGLRAHSSGIPFDDASGRRLRGWLGLSDETFYDERRVAIVPMGFCCPGRGASGDAPPLPECAATWRASLLERMQGLQLTVVLGTYALAYHLPEHKSPVTEAVANWRKGWPRLIALPHPSPRNNGWLARNPWFEREVLPPLRARIQAIVGGSAPDP